MKKLLLIWVYLAAIAAWGQTTPNLNFNIPAQGTQNWGSLINNNFSALDLLLSGNSSVPAMKVSGALTLSGISGSTQCLHVNGSGVVSGTGGDCGSGGGGDFSSITSGTNTNTLVMGSNGVLSYSGTGIIDANQLAGTPVTGITGGGNTAVFSVGPTFTGTTFGSALTLTGALTTNLTGGPFCVHELNGLLTATASDCGSSGGTITAVTATGPLLSTGGTAPNISLQNSASANVTAALGTDTKYFTASGSAAVNGDVITGDAQGGIADSGTLLSSLAPKASPTFTGTVNAAALILSGNLTTNVTGGGTQCLHVNNAGLVSGTGSDCGSGGSTAFSGITAGTNTAALVMGTGGSLTTSGTGTINANVIAGTTVSGTTGTTNAVFSASPTFTGTVTGTNETFFNSTVSGTLTLSGITPGTQCLHVNGSGVVSGTGSDCGSGGDTITSPNNTLAVGGSTSNTTLDVQGVTGKILAGSTPAFTAQPTVGGPTTGNNGKWTFAGLTSGSASISVPNTAGNPSTWLMPTTDPTIGQVLSAGAPSTGVVQLSWSSAGAGTVTVSGSPGAGNIAAFSTGTNIVPATVANILAAYGTSIGSCTANWTGAVGAVNVAACPVFIGTLTGNVSSLSFSNGQVGPVYTVEFKQPPGGGSTLSGVSGVNGFPAIVPDSNAITKVLMTYNGSSWDVIPVTNNVGYAFGQPGTAYSFNSSTVPGGYFAQWVDPTNKVPTFQNDAQSIATYVFAKSSVANQFVTSLVNGTLVGAQPAFSNLSGNITAAQMLALPSADIYVGNGSNVPAAVALTGDSSITNAGVMTNLALQGRTVPSGATTDGQLLIGNSATGNWNKATLTAGSNVTITNGNGTISIASSGGGGTTYNGSGITVWSGSTTSLSGTTYFPFGGGGAPNATEASAQLNVGVVATIANFCVAVPSLSGGGNVVFTLRANGASPASGPTVTVNSGTPVCDNTHTYTTGATDLLDVQAVVTGSIGVTNPIIINAQVGTGGVTGGGVATDMAYWNSSTGLTNWADWTISSHTATLGASGIVDFSGCTGTNCFKIPVKAGCTVSASGAQCFDSTNKNSHDYTNSVDSIRATWPVSTLPTNGQMSFASVASSNVQLNPTPITSDSTGNMTFPAAGGATVKVNDGTQTVPNTFTNTACTAFNASDATDKLTSGSGLQFFTTNCAIPANAITANKRLKIAVMSELITGATRATGQAWLYACTVSGCLTGSKYVIWLNGPGTNFGSATFTTSQVGVIDCFGTAAASGSATVNCGSVNGLWGVTGPGVQATSIATVPTNGILYLTPAVNITAYNSATFAIMSIVVDYDTW